MSSVPDYSQEARRVLANAENLLKQVDPPPDPGHVQAVATVGVGYALLALLQHGSRD
jgi:hypothetical protein